MLKKSTNPTTVSRSSRLAWLAIFGIGVAVGQFSGFSRVIADPTPPPATLPAVAPTEYSQRVVAYVYGTIPVTREELGEYLIARYGAEKLQLLVNTKIIEHACKQRNVTITPEEVDAALNDDLVGLNLKQADFVQLLKKEYGKTLYEWKQDVIRPRVLMSKLCRDQIKVTDEELKKMYEYRYGKKVKVRIIMWPGQDSKIALQQFEKIRSSDDEFDRAARSQANATLAASGGEVAPIARFSGGQSDLVETEAFKLQPGELSRLLTTPQGIMLMKCVGVIEPEAGKDFEKEKPILTKDVIDRRLSEEIPKLFESLRTEAKPQLFLKSENDPRSIINSVEDTLRDTAPKGEVIPASNKEKK
ncbi:peptidylprolyl isomerase [Tuwongella immobilis]|uniref:peptidylprolyl isomerase n=1 Tax=Tuwongella immobilis TaxID=692036 RepID=A0A6C2YQA3_9BACT|nr:peptidylprolyl isomerase [Tuwongella immobilis]VIP03818.1 -type peptidyl-prolyl cis-trans isomerase : Peptidylprolyl isomerase OS=Planctomyces brasiliensis (strain ATCC 49424 / DSM 5305 / JCM 21570 / NBRC 103401 / IFAM 1448) GN=Plabr_2345 PE=4 SV=1: Rotamase_2 [Tuwongella immobilis]VTS05003.1 -type peptidyl-prolyl cis-trans isomerase : Peptidylprolyl isomerase OS=Planctomyces brasiliensis (strain ATCC 49424 / DSM 5305 / JCM 21570 / NBRC 103401 / IFAM 1448) GN=Plabr_2345 PE=4 SV=1: Rotamase_2 [